MDGKMNTDVCCCFCGKPLSRDLAVILAISLSQWQEEAQELYAHKSCLIKSVDPVVPLHPDFFDE
jgi:hypothetical protein